MKRLEAPPPGLSISLCAQWSPVFIGRAAAAIVRIGVVVQTAQIADPPGRGPPGSRTPRCQVGEDSKFVEVVRRFLLCNRRRGKGNLLPCP